MLREAQAIGFEGSLVLSTCHRTELYVVAEGQSAPIARLRELFCHATGIAHDDLRDHGYIVQGREVIEHLFEVAAGLDSPMLGETEIVGQIRANAAVAAGEGSFDPTLETLVYRSLSASRRIRAATGLSQAASLSAAAIALAAELLGELHGRPVIVLGAGQLARALTRRLRDRGAHPVVASRFLTERHRLGRFDQPAVIPLDELVAELRRADVVFCAAAAATPLLSRAMLANALRDRSRPLLVIDLGIPPNVDSRAAGLANLLLRNLDDVHRSVQPDRGVRIAALRRAQQTVRDEVDRFEAWMQARDVDELLGEVRRYVERVRQNELEQLLRRVPDLNEGEQQRLDQVTRSLVKKVLHRPTSQLRAAASAPGRGAVIEALAQLTALLAPSPEPEPQTAPRPLVQKDEQTTPAGSGGPTTVRLQVFPA